MELLEKINAGEIPSREEISALKFESAQQAVAEIRRLYTNNKLMKAWKCTSPTVSKFFESYQVSKTKGNNILVGQAAINHLNKNRKTTEVSKIGSLNQNPLLHEMESNPNSEIFPRDTGAPAVFKDTSVAPKINIPQKSRSENGSYYYHINLKESTL